MYVLYARMHVMYAYAYACMRCTWRMYGCYVCFVCMYVLLVRYVCNVRLYGMVCYIHVTYARGMCMYFILCAYALRVCCVCMYVRYV